MAGRGGAHGHRGGRGPRRSGDHRQVKRDEGICFSFRDTDRCNRGDNCPFAHDGSRKESPSQAVRSKETEEQKGARQSYHPWKRLLAAVPTDTNTMRRVWEGTLRILNAGNRDWTQQLPKDLHSDDEVHWGRLHIHAMLEGTVQDGDLSSYLINTGNFVSTLTHESLLHCLGGDTYVSSLYNFFAGVAGARAIGFFCRLCEALLAPRADSDTSISAADIETTLQCTSVAPDELLKRERRARFNDKLPVLVDLLGTASDTFHDELSSTSATRIANRLLAIRATIARAHDLLTVHASGSEAPDHAIASLFPRQIIVPSDRHDNDKKDNTDIIIFPTRDEIMRDAKESLPYTDSDQPHFLEEPVLRHIDTFSRLARHDTFGELKGALSGLMHVVGQDPNALMNSKLNFGEMRTYQYINAHVSYISFDTRKGLQAQIVFPQPFPARGLTSVDKQIWWED